MRTGMPWGEYLRTDGQQKGFSDTVDARLLKAV
jgi:hypothetical protein